MTTKQVQCLLAYLGYDPGGIDGVDGQKTRQAIRNFQGQRVSAWTVWPGNRRQSV